MSEEFQSPDSIAKIDPADYWEWRTTMEEVKLAKLFEKYTNLQAELLKKDLELSNLKLKMHRKSEESAYKEKKKAQDEYERFKTGLEKKLNISLNNCVIDDITFEVKKINDHNN